VADYGVNINLRVKGQSGLDRLKAKVNELTASIDKIRGVDIMNPRNIGGKGGKKFRNQIKQYRQDMDDLVKAVNKSQGAFGKTANQQVAAADALEEYANSITLGTDAHKEALKASEKQAKAIGRETTQILKNTKAQTQNNKVLIQSNKFNNRSNKAAFTSGAISGAFPLLFGQGPIGGAAGFAGGFLGTKIGGQMGGFAGGLIATSVLQQLTTLRDNITQLADAFDVETFNLDKIIESLGLLGSEEAKRLRMIEELRGRQAALNEATMELTKTIGEDGVASLKEFSDMTKTMGNNLRRATTKMMAGITSTIMNSPIGKFFKDRAEKSERESKLPEDIESTDKVLKQLLANRESLLAKQSQLSSEAQKQAIRDQALGPLKSFRSGGLFPSEIDHQSIVNKKIQEEETSRLLKEQLDSINKSVEARKNLLFKNQQDKDVLKNKKLTTELILRDIKEEGKFLQESISMGTFQAEVEQKIRDLRRDREKIGKTLSDDDEKAYRDQLKMNRLLMKTNELYMGIASSIENGIVDAIEGAIQGTRTLGDVARSVFTEIQRSLISFGVNAFLGGLPGIGGFFRANGGPVSKGKSYIVGERGPEMFTPGSSGMITPNHELGGSSTNVVVNVDASGSSVEGDEQRGRELGRLISVAVQSELLEQKRPGGLLA
jgi:hypothetical protein